MALWQYGNPKSITGTLRYVNEDSNDTEVIREGDVGKKKYEQIGLNNLLSGLLEIYGENNLAVRVTVEVLNPPYPEPRYYLNDDEMQNKLCKDLDEKIKNGNFVSL